MAPEVLVGAAVDSKLDVYAFGLVLWEIMTRQMVFNHYTDRQVFTHVRPLMFGMLLIETGYCKQRSKATN